MPKRGIQTELSLIILFLFDAPPCRRGASLQNSHMNQLRRQILLKAFKLSDMMIMAFIFFLSAMAVSSQIDTTTFNEFLSMRVKVQNFILFLGLVLLWYFIFSTFGLYKSKRFSNKSNEIIDVIKASSLGTLIIFIASIIFSIQMITPVFLGIYLVGSSTMIIFNRMILRSILKQLRLRGRNLRHMLIVGTNSRAVEFAREIEKKPELGYQIIGFMDDEWEGIGEFNKSGHNIVTDFMNSPEFIRNSVVDEVAICLPVKSFYNQLNRIINMCKEQGIIVRSLNDVFDLKVGRTKIDHFEDNQVATVYLGTMNGPQVFVKHVLDFLISIILIVILSPLYLITALLIKLTSPGPVFFIQERAGLNKRRFNLYKFRTMMHEAEKKQSDLEHLNEASGPVFKIKNDPRITSIGKLLRKASIDELPQLFNVLKGDMSLVGPRPLPIRDYNGFDKDWHRRRFSVLPGITCLWQVNGRSDVSFEKWMELDMEYIDNWTIWLDFKILVKTVPMIFMGTGAA